MKEIVENVLKEYKEIKLINDMTIDKINNENLIIDNFLRDIKLIVDCYENKIKELEKNLKLTKFSYYNCLKALADTDSSLKEYLESQGRL